MRRVDEAKASSQTRTWPYPYQHKERPITTSQTLYQGLSVGTAFRDKLLHSGLSWPRLWSLPPKHPSKAKKARAPGMENTITSKENKIDEANTKPAECANEHCPHTYPKTSKVTSSCEIKGTARTTCMRQELSELHPSREAPKRTGHEENKIPNQEANHGSRPEMRAASQQWKTTKQKPSKKADLKITRTNNYPRELR